MSAEFYRLHVCFKVGNSLRRKRIKEPLNKERWTLGEDFVECRKKELKKERKGVESREEIKKGKMSRNPWRRIRDEIQKQTIDCNREINLPEVSFMSAEYNSGKFFLWRKEKKREDEILSDQKEIVRKRSVSVQQIPFSAEFVMLLSLVHDFKILQIGRKERKEGWTFSAERKDLRTEKGKSGVSSNSK